MAGLDSVHKGRELRTDAIYLDEGKVGLLAVAEDGLID